MNFCNYVRVVGRHSSETCFYSSDTSVGAVDRDHFVTVVAVLGELVRMWTSASLLAAVLIEELSIQTKIASLLASFERKSPFLENPFLHSLSVR